MKFHWHVTFSLVLFLLQPQWSLAKEVEDYSKKGPLAVEIKSFGDLFDENRKTQNSERKFFSFRRKKNEDLKLKSRLVPIKVHYPSTKGPFPVVIVSHGAGGSWDGHFALAQHLASRGYVVLCLEHTGSNTERLKSQFGFLRVIKKMIHDSHEVLARPKDISFAIDQALEWNKSDLQLKGKFDLNKIAVLGHSFGAYTAMSAAGMRVALDWIEPKVGVGSGLGPDLFEARLKCAIAFSPQAPGDPFFLKQSYPSLRIPLMGVSGTKDQQHNGDSPASRLESFALWPSMDNKNVFVWLENAHHFDFSDSSGSSARKIPSASREPVQKIVRAATVMFLNECLNKDQTSQIQLTQENLKVYLSEGINKVEILRK